MEMPELNSSINFFLEGKNHHLKLKFKKSFDKNNKLSCYIKIYNLFSEDLFSINIETLNNPVFQDLNKLIIVEICNDDLTIELKNIFVETNDFIYKIIKKNRLFIVDKVFDKDFFLDFFKLSF